MSKTETTTEAPRTSAEVAADLADLSAQASRAFVPRDLSRAIDLTTEFAALASAEIADLRTKLETSIANEGELLARLEAATTAKA